MVNPIYFTKIEYREHVGYFREKFSIVLDISNRELIYQEYGLKKNMPAAVEYVAEERNGHMFGYDTSYPIKKIRSGKTQFKPVTVREELYETIVTFSHGQKLSPEDMDNLLPYCNALDFEPYRDKKMSMDDEGWIGYRDEVQMYFTAISNSYLPKIELPMNYYYDAKHAWPSERLYRYLVTTFFRGKKKYQGHSVCHYGANSLFF